MQHHHAKWTNSVLLLNGLFDPHVFPHASQQQDKKIQQPLSFPSGLGAGPLFLITRILITSLCCPHNRCRKPSSPCKLTEDPDEKLSAAFWPNWIRAHCLVWDFFLLKQMVFKTAPPSAKRVNFANSIQQPGPTAMFIVNERRFL